MLIFHHVTKSNSVISNGVISSLTSFSVPFHKSPNIILTLKSSFFAPEIFSGTLIFAAADSWNTPGSVSSIPWLVSCGRLLRERYIRLHLGRHLPNQRPAEISRSKLYRFPLHLIGKINEIHGESNLSKLIILAAKSTDAVNFIARFHKLLFCRNINAH